MDTTVTLQPPFEYYLWVMVLAAFFAGIAILLIIMAFKFFYEKHKERRKNKIVIQKPTRRALTLIKGEYISKLQMLAGSYANNMVSKREAYQRLSLFIRGFVHEATGINVENYTKDEIKSFGIRKLDELMEEYYIPEFAEDGRADEKDFVASCSRALGVVRKWS